MEISKNVGNNHMCPSILIIGAISQIERERDWFILRFCDCHNNSAAKIVLILQGKKPCCHEDNNIFDNKK